MEVATSLVQTPYYQTKIPPKYSAILPPSSNATAYPTILSGLTTTTAPDVKLRLNGSSEGGDESQQEEWETLGSCALQSKTASEPPVVT